MNRLGESDSKGVWVVYVCVGVVDGCRQNKAMYGGERGTLIKTRFSF